MIALLFVGSIFAQEKISKTGTAPEMDGFTDDVWETAKAYPIDKPFKTEAPTVTATWQALYDDENFYVLVTVEDDNHWPGWEAAGDNWLYDKPEVYWDVNEVLDDAVGAGAGKGHFQLADGFLDGSYDTPITKAASGLNPGGTYAYSLVGEGYVYEHAVPFASLVDANGVAITSATVRPIGFDVTVIDQDEGITTGRQRCVWSCDGNGNNGSTDEAWNNLDGAGEIALDVKNAAKTLKNRTMSVTPNPAVSNITINADFNKVEISNILGQQVKSISATSKTVNVSDLAKGVYVVKAYKNGALQGTAKITKN